MLRKLMIHLALCSLWVVAPAAHAACVDGFYSLDLKTGGAGGVSSNSLVPYISFTPTGQPKAVPAAGCQGWNMAALKIVIPGAPTTCTQANIVVEYEGLPKLWTVNLGDSSTNDGFAGGAAGTTANNAELWIVGEDLSLASGGNKPSVINNPHVSQNLALTDGAVKFVVKNQFVSWGQPYGLTQAPASKNLFAIPDNTAQGDQRAIYLGLNRVIRGPGARTGCGARRVLVTFQ